MIWLDASTEADWLWHKSATRRLKHVMEHCHWCGLKTKENISTYWDEYKFIIISSALNFLTINGGLFRITGKIIDLN